MKNELAMYAGVALLVGLGIGYGIGARPHHDEPAQLSVNAPVSAGTHVMPDGSIMSNDHGTAAEPATMEQMMHDMNAALRGKTGDDFDKAFLSEMIVHHQGAVEMAELARKDAKHQEIKDLAEAIITAQEKEIADMQSWQKDWYGAEAAVSSSHR